MIDQGVAVLGAPRHRCTTPRLAASALGVAQVAPDKKLRNSIPAAELRTSMEASCARHLAGADSGQGWPPAHVVRALTLLNLAGGESVSELMVLRDDEGLCRVVRHLDKQVRSRAERQAFRSRFRRSVYGALPSDSAVHRFLERSHDTKQQDEHQQGKARLWQLNEVLQGLARVNSDLIAFAQRNAPKYVATLDQDATPIALPKFGAERLRFSEFRDGNVPAGYRKLD